MIAVLAVGLVAVLVVGLRHILREQLPTLDSEDSPPPNLSDPSPKIVLARSALAPGGFISLAISRYERRLGRLPQTLDDLLRPPTTLKEGEVWDGPYVHTEALLSDPWGRRYGYLAPGTRRPQSYDLWSFGPDGMDSSGDELGNWEETETSPRHAQGIRSSPR